MTTQCCTLALFVSSPGLAELGSYPPARCGDAMRAQVWAIRGDSDASGHNQTSAQFTSDSTATPSAYTLALLLDLPER